MPPMRSISRKLNKEVTLGLPRTKGFYLVNLAWVWWKVTTLIAFKAYLLLYLLYHAVADYKILKY